MTYKHDALDGCTSGFVMNGKIVPSRCGGVSLHHGRGRLGQPVLGNAMPNGAERLWRELCELPFRDDRSFYFGTCAFVSRTTKSQLFVAGSQ